MRTTVVRCLIGGLLLGVAWPTMSSGRTQVAAPDQSEVASQLLGSDVRARREALDLTRKLRGKMTPALRAALLTTLEREAQLHTRRYEAMKRGDVIQDLEDAEFIGAVTRAVAELRDPGSIRGLAAALGSGATVTNALAEFGEAAAPAVIRVVSAHDSMPDAVGHGLITLRFLVEGEAIRPLSPRTRDAIRRVAREQLTAKQRFVSVLWRAIDLAVAVQDRELAALVQAIADNPQETITRGISDPDSVARIQKLASERLGGVPALPARQSLADMVK